MFQNNLAGNWELITSLYNEATSAKKAGDILTLLNGMGHMAFTDVALIL